MKKLSFVFTIPMFLISLTALAQTPTWKADLGQEKGFIENEGQFRIKTPAGFNAEVLYAHDGVAEEIYFSKSGHVIDLNSQKKRVKSDAEKQARAERKKQPFTVEEWQAFEREGTHMTIERDRLYCQWLGANENVQVIAQLKNTFKHSYMYTDENGNTKNVDLVPSYRKITYKNLYANIDVVYEFFGETGVKYSVIVRPGGDISQVKLKYSKNAVLHTDGTIHTSTKFGDVIDHAPVSFYQGNENVKIPTTYTVNANVISFSVGSYDATKTLVIDPWTQSPAFNTNWDCIWECETDASGNAYIIGGVMPLQLQKYNAAGALQWTYNTPYDTTEWLGTFATDNAGNSYVTNGSLAAIVKVNTAGGLVWNNPSPGGIFGSTEFWNIAFNCDQTQLVVGGTGGFIPPLPYIYRIDMNTGNVLSSVQVCGSTTFGNTQEVRSITATTNEKYYWLAHDTIGYVSQNLSLCPSQSSPFHVGSSYGLGYKCENWRYNNTGLEAIAYYNGFIFVHRGNRLDKRDFNTAAILQSVTIPGGVFNSVFLGGNQVGCSGITIDNCGNIYVGSTNGVYKFNQALTQTASFATTFNVYDVAITSTGDVIAAGSTGNSGSSSRSGSVQSFAAAACAQLPVVCCNPTFCAPTTLCATAAPVTLTPEITGGTWTATPGLNTTTGVFSPSVAGVGTHTITYTLPCGSYSQTIQVITCVTVCIQPNGSLTANSPNGGPYTWQQIVTTTPCNPGFGNFCGAFTVAGTPVTTYTTIGTGPTLNAPIPYPVQVTDGSGNTLVINSAAGIPACTGCPTLTITGSAQVNVACFGQSTGSFNASSSGGASPYDYVLMNGATTVATFNNVAGSQSFTGLAAGTYTLNVTDNSGCTGTTTITITQPASAVSGSISAQTNVLCFGGTTGSVTVSGTGGTGAITYDLNPGPGPQASGSFTNLTAGSYTVVVTDANNCTANVPVTITQPASAVSGSISAQTNVLCFGGTTGGVTVSGTGGTGAITYDLNPGPGPQASGSFTNLAAGSYTVVVTDANGCPSNVPVTITQPASAVSVSLSSSSNATCGNNNGSATVSGSGGTGAITYSWNTSPVQTGPTATGLAAGTYTVTATDANNCTGTLNVTITSSGGPTGSVSSQTNVLCFGGTTGSATVAGSGGTGALSYSWNTSPVQTGPTGSGLTAGSYTVTITDANSCTGTVNVTITQPASAVSASLTSSTNASCGSSNGSATVSGTGGTGALSYSWNTAPVQTGPTATGLGAGSYTVTVTDANNCTGTLIVNISNVGGPTASITSQTNVLCFGGTTGSATVTGSGGTGALTYSWNTSPVQTGPTATGLAAGSYTCTVTDASSCSTTVTVTITQPASAVSGSVSSQTNVLCFGQTNGAATVSGTGGTGALSYSWNTSPVQTGPTASGLGAGSYTVTITDANNCTGTVNVTITAPASAVGVTLSSSTNASCGSSNGSATVSGTGGTGAISYSWNTSPVQTGSTASGLAAGSYTVTATDANGCTATLNVTINNSGAPTLSLSSSVPTGCSGSTGSATVSATGGTGALTYTWNTSPVQTGPTATGLAAGTYTVTVTDANNCSSTLTVTITATGGPSASITAQTNALCNGGSTGSATVNGTGGTGALTYSWNTSPPQTGTTATGLPAGTYTVTVTDANNCTTTASVTITQPAAIAITGSSTNAGCTVANGSATANVTGGTGALTYSWNTNPVQTGSTATGLAAGNYTVTVTDANGCTQTQSVSVGVNNTANVNASPDVTIPLGGSTTLFASGGISYTWTPSTGLSCTNCSSPTASPAITTTYYVTGVDANGCTDTDSVTVIIDMPCGKLFFPNAFSPNSDGENDVWKIYGDCVQNMEIRIFNRWGEVVYLSTNPDDVWDGMVRGVMAESAVFYYIFNGTTTDGEVYEDLKGTITLMK